MSETTEIKIYKIAGNEYRLKNRYTLKDWGEIIKITAKLSLENHMNSLIILLAENQLEAMLSLLLDKPIQNELYEDDFEEISNVIRDFFLRKGSLMTNINPTSKS